jgi:peptidoglycan/LPS O-acetylase OafA/YrhL
MSLQSSKFYLPTLDGWRAVAIAIVVTSHDALHVFGPFSTRWLRANGRVGVDIFFALSGILICTRLLSEEQRSGSIDLRSFYTRRFFRIQPAAWVYLSLVSLLMLTGALEWAFPSVLSSLLLLRNYLPLTFLPKDWYTAHFWSLAVEEHFYLLLPMFLLLVRRWRARLLLAGSGVLFCWQIVQRRHPALQFGWNPEDHTDVAMTGIVVACAFAVLLRKPVVRAWCEKWLHPYATVTVAAVLLVIKGYGDRAAVTLLLLCALPAMLISTVLQPSSLPGKVLEWKPLQMLGKISYSVYLWHMLFFTYTAVTPPVHAGLLFTLQSSTPLRYLAVLVASGMSYVLIEQPLVRFGHRISRRHVALSKPAPRMEHAVSFQQWTS